MTSLCDLLLVTVTETETDVLFSFHESRGGTTRGVYGGDNAYTSLGTLGGARVFHLQCRMGALEPGAALQSVGDAVRELAPRWVVMLGIAFGIDKNKQPIGTVLLSEKLESYEQQKRSKTGILKRGTKVTCDSYLLQVFRMAARKNKVRYLAGLMVSGEKLIDDAGFCEELLRLCPEAIGGEMEGSGVYAACRQTPWILIKGVCDYADGHKSQNMKENQIIAAENATKVVFEAIYDKAFSSEHLLKTVSRHFLKPAPQYRSERDRHIVEQIDRLKIEKKAEAIRGGNVKEIDRQLTDLRRELRDLGATAGLKLLEDRFELIEKIGQGGFAEVWKAWDYESQNIVAMKIMHRRESTNTTQCERFFRGARLMSTIQHEAIPRIILPKGEDQTFKFFVMSFLSGGDLSQYVTARGGLSIEETTTIIQRVGSALSKAHQLELVHRDVKPSNVLLNEHSEAFLTDFDLVRAGDTTGGTRTAGLGTFIYAAPEQNIDAKQAQPMVDVYSLAMTAIFCLHGKPLDQTMLRHPDRIIGRLAVQKTHKLVLEKGIAFDTEDRYQSVADFLKHFQPDQGSLKPKKIEKITNKLNFPPKEGLVAGYRVILSIVKGLQIAMRWIPAGEFFMGSPLDESGRNHDEIFHNVQITNGFWLAEAATSQVVWEAVMNKRPSRFKDSQQPVERVSWKDIQIFLDKLNKKTGLIFRLPTESEWEYACRSGSATAYHFGETINYDQANFGNMNGKTVAVNKYPSNDWGLFQMHGNVWEICQDWYAPYEDKDVIDPSGPEVGDSHVVRGGSWSRKAPFCRSATRSYVGPTTRLNHVGFRLAMDHPDT